MRNGHVLPRHNTVTRAPTGPRTTSAPMRAPRGKNRPASLITDGTWVVGTVGVEGPEPGVGPLGCVGCDGGAVGAGFDRVVLVTVRTTPSLSVTRNETSCVAAEKLRVAEARVPSSNWPSSSRSHARPESGPSASVDVDTSCTCCPATGSAGAPDESRHRCRVRPERHRRLVALAVRLPDPKAHGLRAGGQRPLDRRRRAVVEAVPVDVPLERRDALAGRRRGGRFERHVLAGDRDLGRARE